MYEVMRFWLERGVDGFRVDVMWHLVKDARLSDNPVNPDYDPAHSRTYDSLLPVYTTDRPEVFEIVEEMRGVMEAYNDRVLIGEIYLPIERLVRYYGTAGRGAHLPFNFQLILLPWDARRVEAAIDEYEAALLPEAWPNWVLGNHDKPRIASRFGPAQARAAAVLLLTLRGTPTLYYGDELGLPNGDVLPQESLDPQAIRDPGSPSRDAYRGPMQWSRGPGAGFTRGRPWLPLTSDHERCNVEVQRGDPASMLELHRRLLALRRALPALHRGSYAPVPCGEDLLAFVREHGGERILVAINFAEMPRAFRPLASVGGEVLLSTHERDGRFGIGDALAAHEAVVARIAGDHDEIVGRA
jgi:alpha-glucosidase